MSSPVNSEFTKIDKNVKYALEYNEHLVFKTFLTTMKQNINVGTHLVQWGAIGIQSEPWGVSITRKYLHMINKCHSILK